MSETPQPALDLKGDTPKQWDPENEAQWEGGGKQLANFLGQQRAKGSHLR